MNEETYTPIKAIYQIYLVNKQTDIILFDKQLVAYNETEVLDRIKVGAVLKELGLTMSDVDLYIRLVGMLYGPSIYESPMYAEVIAKTSELTDDEKTNIGKTTESQIEELKLQVEALEVLTIGFKEEPIEETLP